jgi:hypothetical protein
MWTFLATLAGGLVALLGSVVTTYYVQRQAIEAERRARATRAADEIMTAVTALRDLPGEPESAEPTRWTEWSNKKDSLIDQVEAQALILPSRDLRERLAFIVLALRDPEDLRDFAGWSEGGSRQILCKEAINYLGVFYRGEPLPPERPVILRARNAIEEGTEYRNQE